MISSKKLFYIAVVFLAAADLLALTFSNSASLGGAIFTLLHIPLEYNHLQITGITALFLLIAGLILLVILCINIYSERLASLLFLFYSCRLL
jgi:Flp pilus assembly protein protease CpaA